MTAIAQGVIWPRRLRYPLRVKCQHWKVLVLNELWTIFKIVICRNCQFNGGPIVSLCFWSDKSSIGSQNAGYIGRSSKSWRCIRNLGWFDQECQCILVFSIQSIGADLDNNRKWLQIWPIKCNLSQKLWRPLHLAWCIHLWRDVELGQYYQWHDWSVGYICCWCEEGHSRGWYWRKLGVQAEVSNVLEDDGKVRHQYPASVTAHDSFPSFPSTTHSKLGLFWIHYTHLFILFFYSFFTTE